jgi:hypothetical protein
LAATLTLVLLEIIRSDGLFGLRLEGLLKGITIVLSESPLLFGLFGQVPQPRVLASYLIDTLLVLCLDIGLQVIILVLKV